MGKTYQIGLGADGNFAVTKIDQSPAAESRTGLSAIYGIGYAENAQSITGSASVGMQTAQARKFNDFSA